MDSQKDATENLGSSRRRKQRELAQCYVLVYVADKGGYRFFKNQNLYLGVANLTDSVEQAAMMTLDEAEGTWGCMTAKDDWEVWSVRPGIMLDVKSERHIIRARKAILEAEANRTAENFQLTVEEKKVLEKVRRRLIESERYISNPHQCLEYVEDAAVIKCLLARHKNGDNGVGMVS
jgi:hypothetical protein